MGEDCVTSPKSVSTARPAPRTLPHPPAMPWAKRLTHSILKASQGRGGGGMFPCSLEKTGVSPLFPKNKFTCSLKFTLAKFPCSQKYYLMFPTIPIIFQFLIVSYFHKFYLVSHSGDINPQQNASFVSLMNVASPQVQGLSWRNNAKRRRATF